MSPQAEEHVDFASAAISFVREALDIPVVWVRENIVVPNQKQYNWYHRKYNRVPTVDQCYERDDLCIWEADQQFLRDKLVDQSILNIIRFRFEDCMLSERPDHTEKCKDLQEQYLENMGNYHCKYGDMHFYRRSRAALMKQKHRMLWERRYGPVGTGMTPKDQRKDEDNRGDS